MQNDIQAIKNKWTQAAKVRGCDYAITLQDGRQLGGWWCLCDSGACTPSHDALNGFCPSVGFPLDDNGGSVNDRDYFRDSDAQQVTREIARNYDARAIQNAVIVSPDGVVLSGNGRTMAGELAARNLVRLIREPGFEAGCLMETQPVLRESVAQIEHKSQRGTVKINP